MLFLIYASLAVISVASVAAYLKLRIVQDQSANNPNFIIFQRSYIPIYLLFVLGDWLQGPYLYRLYHYHGFVENQVAILYVCGLVSSALVFPAKDYLANKIGHRKTIIVCSIVYAVSCLLATVPNYFILIAGRAMAGATNTILFSSLEAWYISQHIDTHDFPAEWIQVTFNHISFGSSIVAVIAGLIADVFVRWFYLGPVSPFVLASLVLLLVAVLVSIFWSDSKYCEMEISLVRLKQSLSDGLRQIAGNPDIFLVGAIESMFECCLFVFVFIWTPAIGGKKVAHVSTGQGLLIGDVPLGIIFASFMVCFMLGGIICDHIIYQANHSLPRILPLISGASAVLFVLSSLISREDNVMRYLLLIFLQLFEFCCGLYFPIMRQVRKMVLPDDHKLAIINCFRVPLTILSSLTLLFLHNASGGVPFIFLFCGILMTIAFVCSIRFVKSFISYNLDSDNTQS